MSDISTEIKDVTASGSAAGSIMSVVGAASNWKTYLIYLLLIFMAVEGGFIVWQRGSLALSKVELSHRDLQITNLTTERDLALVNEKSARDALSSQNTLIQDAGNNYISMQKQFEFLDKTIQDGIKNGTLYKNADDARKQETPKSCQEALDFMNRNTTHEK